MLQEYLTKEVYPLIQNLDTKMQVYCDYETEDEIVKIKNVFKLCSSQIKKCVLNFLDVIKMELKNETFLQVCIPSLVRG